MRGVPLKLEVEWGSPVALRRLRPVGYAIEFEKLPASPGLYVFGRRWGDSFEALYVGKAMNVRGRVKGQLNNLRLMTHIREAKVGNRVVVAGEVNTKPGQQIEK